MKVRDKDLPAALYHDVTANAQGQKDLKSSITVNK